MNRPRPNPHFFVRERDGSVRLRIRFDAELATMIENAAGTTPLIPWIVGAITDAAEDAIAQQNEDRPTFPKPEE